MQRKFGVILMNKRTITILFGLLLIITAFLLDVDQLLKTQIILVITVFTLIFAFGIDYQRYQNKQNNKQKYKPRHHYNQEKHKTCTICGTKNKSSNTFCYKCQSSLESVICPVCEHVNEFDQKYCSNCNAILQNKRRH
jgi:predicted nucleic acid-binding Zn ribbon protein